MLDNNHDADGVGANRPPKDNNQETGNSSAALANAIVSAAQPTPVCEGGQGTSTSLTTSPVDVLPGLPQLPNATGRDTDAVTIVMLLPLLSYDQLRRLVLPSQDGSVLRRRGLLLEKEGWLQAGMLP